MSKNNPKKKVIPVESKIASTQNQNTASQISSELLFNKTNYLIILGGFGLIFLGMLLMMGGHMPSHDVWDDNIIYSFRRTVLAPFIILIGLVVGGYGIFKK